MSELSELKELKKLAALIKEVFGNESGQLLLKEFEDLFQNIPLFDSSPEVMAYKVGKCDVIREIKWYLTAKPKDLKAQIVKQPDPLD